MTRERFLQIKSLLRFDDPLRRDKEDSLAPIRDLFEQFNSRLRLFYVASPNLTIDEQLLEFHGRVKFRQYIKSKPGKFGIKIIWLCDAETFYCLNGVVYIGVGTLEPGKGITTSGVTLHLMKPYLNTGRNLTGDNWFTSMELVNTLRENNTTYIGTIKSNSRGVPPIAKCTKDRVKKDTKIFQDDNRTTLVSFWDKGVKPVLLVDSFHRHVPAPEVNCKAETVLAYNRTKSGVDIADKRMRGLTCKRKCRRWPYAVFSNLVDAASNNATIVFNKKHPGKTRKQDQHYSFLTNAGYQLVDAHIRRRIENVSQLKSSTRAAMRSLGYNSTAAVPSEPIMEKSRRCYLCENKKDRKTNQCCPQCHQPRCREHRSELCVKCEN